MATRLVRGTASRNAGRATRGQIGRASKATRSNFAQLNRLAAGSAGARSSGS